MDLLFHSKTFPLRNISNETNIPSYLGLIKKNVMPMQHMILNVNSSKAKGKNL